MKKYKKLAILIGSIIVVSFLTLILVYNSPVGENFLKSYISSKLKLLNRFEIEDFNYKWNSFSVILKKGSNYISIYGDLFPFDAIYEANLNNLEEIDKNFRGKIESKGTITYRNYAVINGNALMADGYGNLKLQCNNSCVGIFNGKSFDTQKLFYMIKLNFPYLLGRNDLNIIKKKDLDKILFRFQGMVNYKNLIVLPKSIILAKIKFKDRQNYEINATNISKDINLKINSKEKNGKIFLKASGIINLPVLRNVLLYPVTGKEKINFYYDNIGDILKFFSDNFKGYYADNTINIQLNTLSAYKFFRYLYIKPFCHGNINGDIVIKQKEGEFNIISSNCKLIDNDIVKFIEKKVKRDIKNLKIAFLKGKFDNKKLVFNILSKSDNFIISIQKGVYFYNGKYRYNVDVIIDGNYKYVFKVDNNGIKLLKTLKSYKVEQKILVY